MRKPLWILIVAVMALTALISAPRVHSAGDPAPQVVDTEPVRGAELLLDSPITFYFDQPMDRASVEAAFKTTPSITGGLSWTNDTTLVFKPSAQLTRATEITFTVEASAKAKTSGLGLRDKFALKLRTTGFLEVTQVLPANGAVDVEAKPTITILFNRPVVPLLPVEEMQKLPSPIAIEPAAEGQGEWLSTSIYTFKPKGLKGGTLYRVTVVKGLTDVTGSILQNDFTFTFSTVAPRAIEINPSDTASGVLRDREVDVYFSQPMDTNATEKAFSLTAGNTAVPVSITWNDEHTILTAKPKELLAYGTTYLIKVDGKGAISDTGAPISDTATATFSTIQLPQIIDTRPQDGENPARSGGFYLQFSAPMKLDDFKSRLTVDPKPTLFYDDYMSDQGFFYEYNFSSEPSTDYTVTIDVNGLVDIYGTPLILDPKSSVYKIVGPGKAQVKFTTAEYPPEASLQTGSDVGMYSAYNPTTRVYTTHRNINKVELSLYGLSLTEFLQLNGRNGYDFRNTFVPKDFLRRWELKVENPHNVLRYDLLTITDQGPSLSPPTQSQQGFQCDGAPPTRLQVGIVAVVLPDDPSPLRVRDIPGLDGIVLAQVKPGVKLTIVGGPRCVSGFVWWNVLNDDSTINGWAAEGAFKDKQPLYYLGPLIPLTPTPKPQVTNTPTKPASDKPGSLRPGAYFLQFSAPEIPSDYYRNIDHYMLVATANVTLKTAPRQAMAWVTDLQTGQPVSGTTVQFYMQGIDDTILRTLGDPVKTDSNGLASLELPVSLINKISAMYAVIDDGTNLGIGISDWTGGIDPYDFNLYPNRYYQDQTIYMYTDRSLYKPGQPVYFKGVLRTRDDMTYGISDKQKVLVEAFDDSQQSIYRKEIPIDQFGSFSDSFTIDQNGSLGNYQIVAAVDYSIDKNGQVIRPGSSYTRTVSVAQYRVPEIQVKATPDQTDVVQGDKINIAVDSTYFFGGAVSNAKVTWDVGSQDYYFNYKGSGSYNFTDYNDDEGYYNGSTNGGYHNSGDGTTDAQGKFVISLPAELGKDTKQSQNLIFTISVTDETGQTISTNTSVTVHQGQFYIGVSPENYVAAAKSEQKVNLISVGWDSKPQPNADLAIRVVERIWNSVKTVEPGTGRTVWDYQVKENDITKGVVHTDADGKAVYTFTPPNGGIYKIYATSRDSKGNQVTSSAFLWVAGPDYVPWRQQNSNRIDLKIDKTDYNVGDTASILIASPFQGDTTALITVERGGIQKTEVLKLTNNSTVYKLPITANMAPNAFVSVVIVKGVDKTNPVAAFRMGLIQFGVQTDRFKLNITVTPDKPQAGPRETVNYKVKVTDYAGKPVQAEIGTALTDLAVLSLLPDTSTPILDHFYSQQGLSVSTALTLTQSVDQETQDIINTIKGGGGGGPEGGIFEVRQKFVDTPLWQPFVKTDANGEAIVTATLPDQLTTWRLDVRAISMPTGELNTTLVGQTTFDLISTKPVLVRPVTPRFYVVGDTGTIAAVVNNNTDQAQEVKVNVDLKGVTLSGPNEQTATIPSKGRQRFNWNITVQDVGAVGMTFFAQTTDGKYTDAAKSAVGQGDDKTLPVYKYQVPETVATGGVIGKEGGVTTEGIFLPKRFNISQGKLNIKLESSLAAGAVAGLNALDNYPFYDTESVISAFLPNVFTYRALKQLGLDDPKLKDKLDILVNQAIQRLYNEQHVDGGWGWWVQDYSNPIITAYAVIGLTEAGKQGFDINKSVMDQAIAYIEKSINDIGKQPATWQLNRQAFLYYALSQANPSGPYFSAMVNLFGIREKMGVYARAYLAMAFHALDAKSTTYTDPLVSDLQNRAVASATGMHWEEDSDSINWNTDTRTTAIVLKALVELQPTNLLIPNVVRWLMVARTADMWETTQETVWALWGLTDWMVVTNELRPNYVFDVSINGKALGDKVTASPETARTVTQLQVDVKDLLNGELNKLDINRTGGDGNLYYTAYLTAYLPVDQVKALSRGITIQREYSLANDPKHTPITQAHVGDVLRVTLTIIAPSDLDYVTITDPIPAGAESIDTQLATSGVGEPPQLSLSDPFLDGWGWWWFSKTELRDDRTVMYATYLPRGTYEYTYTLRAGLAGQYNVIPTTGQENYFPEVYGRSEGMLFTLLPSDDASDPTNQVAGATATPVPAK